MTKLTRNEKNLLS